MEDAIFIKVLEHGENVGVDGTNFPFLENHIQKELSLDFSRSEHKHKKEALRHIFEECFNFFDGGQQGKNAVLKTEYYFRLIEYRELQEARKASRQANNNAWAAIRISFLAIIFGLIVAGIQILSPTKINKDDLQALINSNTPQQEIKLDKLQMAQILSALESSQSKADIQKPKAILPSNEAQHHELINRYFEEE